MPVNATSVQPPLRAPRATIRMCLAGELERGAPRDTTCLERLNAELEPCTNFRSPPDRVVCCPQVSASCRAVRRRSRHTPIHDLAAGRLAGVRGPKHWWSLCTSPRGTKKQQLTSRASRASDGVGRRGLACGEECVYAGRPASRQIRGAAAASCGRASSNINNIPPSKRLAAPSSPRKRRQYFSVCSCSQACSM